MTTFALSKTSTKQKEGGGARKKSQKVPDVADGCLASNMASAVQFSTLRDLGRKELTHFLDKYSGTKAWLQDGYSQFFRSYVLGPLGLKGPWLHYAMLQNLIPSFP